MKYGILAVTVFWLSIVGISCWWNMADEHQEGELLAFETARAFFRQLVITRAWNAEHEGVYVPLSKDMVPNPYLDDPLRDLVTDKGVALTKINPAYMTRQIAEIAALENGIRFHITSLKPIRPANKATAWEEEWLRSFQQGKEERGDFVREGGRSFFRYMAPLKVEESCLMCHAKQGYKKGDIRGGISITIPYLSEEKNTTLLAGYAITAVAGVILILTGGTLLARKRAQLLQSNEALQLGIAEREQLIADLKEANSKIKTLSGIVPICMYCKGIRDDKGYWSVLEKFISEHSTAQFSHGICPKCMKERHPDLIKDEG
jgi:Protein of unknown function (DUF3365)